MAAAKNPRLLQQLVPASTSTASTSTASSGGLEASAIAVGLKFTGGQGKADASLSPVTIGYTDELGGTPALQEMKASSSRGGAVHQTFLRAALKVIR